MVCIKDHDTYMGLIGIGIRKPMTLVHMVDLEESSGEAAGESWGWMRKLDWGAKRSSDQR